MENQLDFETARRVNDYTTKAWPGNTTNKLRRTLRRAIKSGTMHPIPAPVLLCRGGIGYLLTITDSELITGLENGILLPIFSDDAPEFAPLTDRLFEHRSAATFGCDQDHTNQLAQHLEPFVKERIVVPDDRLNLIRSTFSDVARRRVNERVCLLKQERKTLNQHFRDGKLHTGTDWVTACSYPQLVQRRPLLIALAKAVSEQSNATSAILNSRRSSDLQYHEDQIIIEATDDFADIVDAIIAGLVTEKFCLEYKLRGERSQANHFPTIGDVNAFYNTLQEQHFKFDLIVLEAGIGIGIETPAILNSQRPARGTDLSCYSPLEKRIVHDLLTARSTVVSRRTFRRLDGKPLLKSSLGTILSQLFGVARSTEGGASGARLISFEKDSCNIENLSYCWVYETNKSSLLLG